jgi:hypothetical protein
MSNLPLCRCFYMASCNSHLHRDIEVSACVYFPCLFLITSPVSFPCYQRYALQNCYYVSSAFFYTTANNLCFLFTLFCHLILSSPLYLITCPVFTLQFRKFTILPFCISRLRLNLIVGITTFDTRNSAVGIAIGYRLNNRGVGVRVPVGSRIFSTSPRPELGPTQLPIQWLPAVKRPGREADHSPPTSAEVKKMWIYTATPSWHRA